MAYNKIMWGLLIGTVVLVVVAYFGWRAQQAPTLVDIEGIGDLDLGTRVSDASGNPVGNLPETNPFETASNPFNIYENPFE